MFKIFNNGLQRKNSIKVLKRLMNTKRDKIEKKDRLVRHRKIKYKRYAERQEVQRRK